MALGETWEGERSIASHGSGVLILHQRWDEGLEKVNKSSHVAQPDGSSLGTSPLLKIK